MKLPEIQPGFELKSIHSEAGVLQLVTRIKAATSKHKRENPLQTQNYQHPEIGAYRKKVSKKGRFLAQAYLKEIKAQVIDPQELRSSQDNICVGTYKRFLKHPEEINRPQLTRRYGNPENGFREYAIVGVTSDGKKFVIDGNHRISAACKLGKKVKVKIIDLAEFLEL